jgi:putative cardiolipin synthase
MRRVGLALLPLLLMAACRTLPDDLPLAPPGHALPPSSAGPIAEAEWSWRDQIGDERSGFLLLDRNEEALRWRLAIIDSATSSLDLQYYLWYGDSSGRLLVEAVIRAADRGVRVRILVDDLLFVGADQQIADLDAHPNLELRLFNPWRERSGGAAGRAVEFLARMDRLNSRMHNKLTVADNRLAICGGRNLGDHYFGLADGYNFHDLDVLALGPAARRLSAAFDAYWNAAPVVAAGTLAKGSVKKLAQRRELLRSRLGADPDLSGFPLDESDWTGRLRDLPSKLHPGTGQPIYDLPEAEAGKVPDGASRAGLMEPLIGARKEILVENAYWVPTEATIENLRSFEQRGVQIRFLTNSLASHDVPAVNSEFKNWRRPILETGVELYELRHDAALKELQDTPPVESDFLGLHSKTFVVDREAVYVGSHNFDPRSNEINTELGLLVRSPGLAEAVAQRIERDMEGDNSWRVALDEDGDIYWEAGSTRVTRQPARNGWQRVQDSFFGILPIEDQL